MGWHPSEGSVVNEAERIVERSEVKMFDRLRFMDKEAQAIHYRDRWRFVGLALALVIMGVGLATTSERSFLNVLWPLASLVVSLGSVMIGRYVYSKRSPW